MPVKQCVLPTFLITSRKNRRNLFPSFLHDTQTAGAVGSAGHSWERAEVLRAIRQQGTAVEWGHAQAQWQHWAAPHGSLLLVLLARLGDVGFVTSVQHRCSGHLVHPQEEHQPCAHRSVWRGSSKGRGISAMICVECITYGHAA